MIETSTHSPKRRGWIRGRGDFRPEIQAFLLFLLFAAGLRAAGPAGESGADGPLRILSSGTLDYDIASEEVSAAGPVEAGYGIYRLEAGELFWNRAGEQVRAAGGVRIANPGVLPDPGAAARRGDVFDAWWPRSYRNLPFVLRADSAELTPGAAGIRAGGGVSARFPLGRMNAASVAVDRTAEGGDLSARRVEAGDGAFLVRAGSVSADDEAVDMKDALLVMGEPSDWGPRIHADRIRHVRGQETISLYGLTLGVGPVPVLYLPRGWLRDWNLGVSFDLGGGFQDNLGVYGDFGAGFQATSFLRLDPMVSYYERRGVMASPDFSWERTSDSGDYHTRGSVLAGAIHDNGGAALRGVDRFGDAIGVSRGYALARGLAYRRGGWSFVTQVEARSDSEVLRDFRPGLESRYFAPESFSEWFVPFGGFSFTALGRFRTLDMTESLEAVPAVRLDLEPARLGTTNLRQEGWAGFARLEREDSAGGNLASANRWEAAYRVAYPLPAPSWLSITPTTGIRQRVYQDVAGRGTDGDATLFEAGIDVSAAFHRRWEVRNRVWDVDGLLHQVRPLAGFRWMPSAGLDDVDIPDIMPAVYSSGVDPLGFDNLVHRSDSGAGSTLRLGVENRLLAGRFDDPRRMRELGSLGLYQDWLEGGAALPDNTMLALGFSPAPWIGLDLFARVETARLTLVECVPGLALRDGDRWESRWYFQSLQRRVNQLLWEADIAVTGRDRFLFDMRYNGQSQKITRQAYGWSRRIGNAWIFETRLIFRKDDEREPDFQVNVSMTSLLF
ncbi:MAG: hypothetical protein ACLFTU_03345 [Puniceicoccaceae bacterium]